MTAAALLADLARRGVRVVAEGDTLRLRGPASAVAAARGAVAARKPELLDALQNSGRSTERIPESPVSRVSGISGMPSVPPARETQSVGGAPELPVVWRDRLRAARDWADLRLALDDAQVAFASGELSGPEVERLARLCAVLASCLPEVDPYGPRIYVELPRNTPPDTCHACRRGDWWTDRYGVRHCRVCHPPGPGAEA